MNHCNGRKCKNHEFQIAALKSQIEKNFIRSPIDGKIVSSSVTPGDMVFGGGVVGKVISHELLIEVTLNEEDFAGILEGQEAAVTLYTFGRRIFEATVSRLSATIDPNTGRRKLYLSIDSEIEIPTGGSGRAEIVKGVKENALIIPRKALLGNSVLIVKTDSLRFGKFALGPVIFGKWKSSKAWNRVIRSLWKRPICSETDRR